MSQALTALSFWLHALSSVVFIGHYLLLSLVYLPVFEKNQVEPLSATILSGISKRSRSWLYASILIFAVTGTYLTFVDPNYLGIGNFGNPWAILMLVKHILILAMLGMGFWFNGILRVGPLMVSKTGATQAWARFRQYSNWMAIAGVIVLLLTAISQAQ
jgi:uncharacterized membrane protein